MDEIHTERLLMRRANMDDLAAIHALLSNPVPMRFWSSLPHTKLEQSETWLRSMVDADLLLSDDFILEQDGRVIGKLGCWRLPEVGFLIDPQVWGQGYASEALSAYLARRRAIGSPDTLRADVDPRNQASLALLIRHGFTETHRAKGTWQIGDELCDSVYLELKL